MKKVDLVCVAVEHGVDVIAVFHIDALEGVYGRVRFGYESVHTTAASFAEKVKLDIAAFVECDVS